METISSEGTEFSLAIAAASDNTPITVDWGDGNPVAYVAGKNYIDCKGTLKGKKVVVEGAITKLNCIANKLTSLDISQCPSLEVLQAMFNYLTKLNVENNPNLVALECFDNQIKELKIDKLSKLIRLVCTNNFLESLDLSQSPELEYFDCAKNRRIEKIDLSNNKKLKQVLVYECSITDLKLPQQAPMMELYCHSNKLTQLNISYPQLTILNASSNQIGEFKIQAPLLENLNISKNQIKDVDLTSFSKLSSVMLTGNPDLSNLKLGQHKQLVEIGMSDCKVSDLNLSQVENLHTIWFKNNLFEYIDFSKCNKLSRIVGGGCNLAQIILPISADSLSILQIPKNQIESIDLSKYTQLKTIDLGGNRIKEINLTHNTNLQVCNLNSNQLTSVDLSQNRQLNTLGISANKLSACELDKIYAALPTLPKSSPTVNLYNGTKSDQETLGSKTQVAVEKGWKPLIAGDGKKCTIGIEEIASIEIRSFVMDGTLWVYLSQGTQQISVYDLQGNIIHTQEIEAGTHPLLRLEPGNYIVHYAKGIAPTKIAF